MRPNVVAVDQLLGTSLKVLDDGFVRLVDYMGDDNAVVQAARVSYGAGTRQLSEARGLIRYLMHHRHTTPFEMCELKLHVRVPMDTWRQWIRHRTASVNEYSTRYSIAIDAIHRTAPGAWRLQSPSNRQGSSGVADDALGARLSVAEANLLEHSKSVYDERIAHGIAREQARKDLPLSTYTEAFWKIDLHNLLHFLELRMDSHAQSEIREYASTIGYQVVAKWVPLVWEAFEDYRLKRLELSALETSVIRTIVAGEPTIARDLAVAAGAVSYVPNGGDVLSREGRELERKLNLLGLAVPW